MEYGIKTINGQGKIQLVEFARGLAALAVVLLHGASMMKEPQYSGEVGLGGIFRLGFLGVDFFFVLSGFIILYVHWSDIGIRSRFARYGWRRLVRVLPTYWIILFVALALNFVLQTDHPAVSGSWFVQEMSLTAPKLWLGPAWTLQHEMTFYILFSLLLLNIKLGATVLCIWFGIIGYLGIFLPGYTGEVSSVVWWNSQPGTGLLLHPTNISFAFGLLVAFVARVRPKLMPALTICLLSIFGLWTCLIDWEQFTWHVSWRYFWTPFLFSGILALLIVCAKYVPTLPSSFTFLGTISYSLYLVHVVPIGISYAVFSRLGFYQQTPEIVLLVIGLSLSLIASSLCYYWFEKPILGRLQALVK